jgi:stage II sporulation protein GA (sporulation sigma-E factor processing peptidase)
LIVWVDVIVLENIIVNYFLLIITAQTLCIKLKNKRAILSSAAAGLYTLIIFYDELKFLTVLPLKLLAALLIVYGAFGKNKLIFLLKSTFIYILYTFVLAGLIFFLEYRNMGNPAYGYYESFNTKWLITALMVVYIVINRVFYYIISRRKLGKYTYNIEIFTKSSSVTVTALLDTGNELKEPITNLPVIIVEKSAVTGIDTSLYDKLYIPYKVVSGQANFLEAFKPEKIKISYDKDNFQYKNAVIGISDIKLSEFNEYQALLSRDII